MSMKGRSWQSEKYRYGFNGKENDSDWEVQDYGFRIYKPELSKFMSPDPLTKSYPELTPYQFASNSPIENIDLDGLERMSTKYSDHAINMDAPKLKVEQAIDPIYRAKKSPNVQAIETQKYKDYLRKNNLYEYDGEIYKSGEAASSPIIYDIAEFAFSGGLSSIRHVVSKSFKVLATRNIEVQGRALRELTKSIAVELTTPIGKNKGGALYPLSNKADIGPVMTGIYDTKTGKFFFATNEISGEVPNLHPILQDRLDALKELGGTGYQKTAGAGSHSEIYALNNALWHRQELYGKVTEANLSEFLLHNRTLKGKNKGVGVPSTCPDCSVLTNGVNVIK